MGAITASDVTIVESWREPRQGGPNLLHRIVSIALSGNGGTADDIPASLLGFKFLQRAQPVRYVITSNSALLHIPVIIEADKAGLLTVNLQDATDATRASPANVPSAGTLTVHVVGLEAN